MFERIDHVGIIVADIDSALAVYAETFELELVHREVHEDVGLDIALLQVGESRVELLASTSPDSVFADAKPGMHHVAYGVADIDAALELLKSREVELVDTTPRVGVLASRIAFLHPHASGGVLTELVEAAPA
jgi:methylmalonyl-CoA/ethylmalonyl-CoA epimerase